MIGGICIVDGTHGGHEGTAHTETCGNQTDERRRTAFDTSCGGELARFACCPRVERGGVSDPKPACRRKRMG